MSDAVDRAVAALDFRDLSGERVYLDTQYLKNAKPTGFVTQDYIISAIRQQMFAANCQVMDTAEEADIIVEARVGALGTDGHDVTYGVPANNSLSSVVSMVPNGPTVPPFPELSLAKRSEQLGAAKVAVYAYDKATRQPIWQSGISQARSTARDMWVFGVGPLQRGTIYKGGPRFAGAKLDIPLIDKGQKNAKGPMIAHDREVHFVQPEQAGEEEAAAELAEETDPETEQK